jgi:very-short-patch-repair endonuclease
VAGAMIEASDQPSKGPRGYSDLTLNRAKRLRREQTDAEKKLWSALRNRQIANAKFREQQPIGPYIADFVCQEHRLIVEADGSQHLDNNHDIARDAYLAGRGYRVLRFWNTDILLERDSVLAAIYHALTTPHPSAALRLPPSPSRGEGILESD